MLAKRVDGEAVRVNGCGQGLQSREQYTRFPYPARPDDKNKAGGWPMTLGRGPLNGCGNLPQRLSRYGQVEHGE